MPRRNPQANQNRQTDIVREPIRVFVSSHQKEFARLREELAIRIGGLAFEKISKSILVADLAEHSPGTRVRQEIDELLDKCSIYLIVIGRRSSKWVKYEYEYALSNNLPILAYEYYKPTAQRAIVKTDTLVQKLMSAGIKLRGHNPRFHNISELIDAILNDLAELVAKIVNGYAGVKKTTSKV
jgi:hypothetical protein